MRKWLRKCGYSKRSKAAKLQAQAKLVADLTANSVSSSQVANISDYLLDWESVDFDDKRRVLDTLVSQVQAIIEQVVIHWKL